MKRFFSEVGYRLDCVYQDHSGKIFFLAIAIPIVLYGMGWHPQTGAQNCDTFGSGPLRWDVCD